MPFDLPRRFADFIRRLLTQPIDELTRWQRALRFALDLARSGDVDAALARARAAQKEWAKVPVGERARIVRGAVARSLPYLASDGRAASTLAPGAGQGDQGPRPATMAGPRAWPSQAARQKPPARGTPG